MVALAMNGLISRTVLFSLVLSAANALTPHTLAQEAGGTTVAVSETAQRQQSVREAMQKVQEARNAYATGRYSDSVELYQAALSLVAKGPASEKLVKFIKDSLADALVAKAMDYRKVGRVDEAVEFIQEALVVSPGHKFAQNELEKTQDPVRTNPALTPQHIGNVEEVQRLLSLAYGHYDLGNYDKALEAFNAVCRIDAYNTAARRGIELVQKRRSAYYSAARDAYRAQALNQVDKAWEEPLPSEQVVNEDVVASASGDVLPAGADAESSIIAALQEMVLPQVAFEAAPLHDVLDALRGQIARFESQGQGAARRINLLADFGAPDSEIYKNVMSRLVNLNLENISLADLLNYLDEQLGIMHYISPMGVVFCNAGKDSGPIVERVYSIPPHFFDPVSSESEDDEDEDDFASRPKVKVKRQKPEEVLKSMDVSFPKGASARYDASNRLLTVRNTMANHELIQELVSAPTEMTRAVVLNVIAMEIDEKDLNELGFEWLFNFHLGPKALFGSGTKEEVLSDLTAVPSVNVDVDMPSNSYSATSGLRSGSQAFSADNISTLISQGKAGLYAGDQKAPGILSFRGVWDSGDVTMIMRGAAQKKGADIMTNPRIVMTPGRDEQVVFANIQEMFYPETYTEPQISSTRINLGRLNGEDDNTYGSATVAAPAHPESFIRYGVTEDSVGGVGSVVQVHSASVSHDDQVVTLALTVTLNEFEGFVNWGTPIYSYLMRESDSHSTKITLSENQILTPVFKRRMENTVLEVGAGSVVVIGGLKEMRSVRYEDKLPVLGDLPMVGRMFRSEGEEKVRKAFLMFVKVDVVDPTGRNVGTGERPSDVAD